MKSVLFSTIILLSSSVFASWAVIPLETIVQETDLVVVGELTDVHKWQEEVKHHKSLLCHYDTGKIRVKKVIWGFVRSGDVLDLHWENLELCPSIDHASRENKTFIWLLTRAKNGEVRADYPSRIQDISDEHKIMHLLKKYPVVLRTPQYTENGTAKIKVIYRNATSQNIRLPKVIYKKDKLSIDPRISLLVYQGTTVKSFKQNFVLTKTMEDIVVEPGSIRSLSIDLEKFFVLSRQNCKVQMTVQGQPISNAVVLKFGD